MGYRKFRLTKRKNAERRRLSSRNLKTIAGRPSKHQKKYIQRANTAAITEEVPSIADIRSHLKLPSSKWTDQSNSLSNEIKLCKLGDRTRPSGVDGVVMLTFVIKGDRSWTLNVHGRPVTQCSAISHFPQFVTPENVNDQLQCLDRLKVCAAHPDERFLQMAKEKKSFKEGQVSASIDDVADVTLNGDTYCCTLRTVSCQMLVPTGKCANCVAYRATLRTMHTRWQKITASSPSKYTSTSSRTNFRYLTTPQKRKRMTSLRARVTSAERKVNNLMKKIKDSTDAQGVTVDDCLHQDLSQIMEEHTPSIIEQFPEGSFKRLFWEQQREALRGNSRQMRWHPTMIKWCLNIKLRSSAAYEAIRDSGFISLPSSRTLRDYTHHMKSGTGFLPEVTEQLLKEVKMDTLKLHEKHVAVCFDEVRIKDNLVYDKHGLQLIGYVDIGDINNELLKFERSCSDDSSETSGSPLPVAKHMLVFMVRGLFIDLKFPYAQFATHSLTADMLFPLAWEAVQRLEAADFKVVAFVCDGASQNRKFFRMHSNSKETVYKTNNPYAGEPRPIYFFSDAPHLIKTVRNCWANSFAHSNSRAMWINGQHISWLHLTSLNDKCTTGAGLSMLPKIKSEHVRLNSYSRMKVYLASQVLSASVAKALKYYNDPATKETQRFCQMFDRFFDCLNVRSYTEGRKKRKPDLLPYRTVKDTRFEWLKNDFLGYLAEWNKSVSDRAGFTAAQKQQMMLSRETVEGLTMTVNSFVDVSQYLLSYPGVRAVFSERFNQDPLESFFGKQRSHGGHCDNPTVKDFVYNTTSLRLQGALAKDPVRGNCRQRVRDSKQADLIDNTPLPKRKRYSAKK